MSPCVNAGSTTVVRFYRGLLSRSGCSSSGLSNRIPVWGVPRTFSDSQIPQTGASGAPKSRGSAYDPAGHTAAIDDRSAPTAADVDYAYDGSDNLISRKESAGGVGAKTRLYFYWGMGTTLAEETDGRGATLARYLVDGGDTLAQETYRAGADGHRDPTDTAGTWTWLLDDPSGNVATHVGDDGAVSRQVAFDPYGRPVKGGTGKSPTAPGSSLGFQGAHTDPTTGSVILGPRQYDPTTARFTSPDVYAAGGLDLGLGTDELTGNRYLFAAANPVAYFEDGHEPTYKKHKEQILDAARRFGVEGSLLATIIEHEGSGRDAAATFNFVAIAVFEEIGLSGRTTGIGQLKDSPENMQLADEAGLGKFESKRAFRDKLKNNTFSINLAAAYLKRLQMKEGLTGRDAFIAYAFSPTAIGRLKQLGFDPARYAQELYLRGRGCKYCAQYEQVLGRYVRYNRLQARIEKEYRNR